MGNDDQKTVIGSLQTQKQRVATIELDGGISFSVNEGSLPLLIGRGSDCDICIPVSHVSRHHCELFLANGELCLKDLSSNGTLIGGRNVHNESVLLEDRTNVFFAGETKIAIVANAHVCASDANAENRRFVPDRRGKRASNDRATCERRGC